MYLSVPYSDKDKVKSLGAKWDPEERKWYIHTNADVSLFTQWLPVIIKGEDRTFGGNKLFVDLIPKSCWFINARACLSQTDWYRVRQHVYERANYICECCGINTKSYNTTLEAHERWHYDMITHIQKLVRLIALCRECHEVTHIGLARQNGREDIAKEHLRKVTGMSQLEIDEHIRDAINLSRQRDKYTWTLDLSILSNSGITVTQPSRLPRDKYDTLEEDTSNPYLLYIFFICLLIYHVFNIV